MKDMGIPLEKNDRHFTYADYVTWPDEERWEIIEGAAYDMSPAPGTTHQRISMYLSRFIAGYLEGKPCEVFHAPFDVLLPESPDRNDAEIDSVVQPDIVVVCDPGKVQERGCFGAPDWVMEILSPRTSRKDQREKYDLYQKHGVKEYWIIDPYSRTIQAYRLESTGKFGSMELAELPQSDPRGKKTPEAVKIRSHVLPELEIDLESLFAGHGMHGA